MSAIGLAAFGCGSTTTANPGNPDGGGPGVIDAAPAGPADAHPAPPGAFQLTFPDVVVAAGGENTQCVTKRLGNTTALHVGSIHNELGDGSHHVIIYKVADTTEVLTPVDCQPFTSTLNPAKGAPLMVTQKKDDLLELPTGVAFTLAPNQMIRIEMHYINTSADTPVTVHETTTFLPIADADFKNEAGFLFVGDIDVNVPAGQKVTLGPIFHPLDAKYTGPSGVNFFAITGHEHHLGTNVTVQMGLKGGTMTSVYDVMNWIWSEPATVKHDPPFQVPVGGGFQFTCNWDNTGPGAVNTSFGESANNEMCFFWAYYYPDKGAEVCLHTDKFGGGLDTCCPGGIAQICNFFGN